jgi:hypothetical protein
MDLPLHVRERWRTKTTSDALPYSPLRAPNAIRDAINHAEFYSRLQDVVIRVYDGAGNVIEAHEHAGDFKEP